MDSKQLQKNSLIFINQLHLKIFGHQMGPTTNRFLKGLAWLSWGSLISIGLLFITNLMAGRWLGPTQYGKYSLVISLNPLLITTMMLGFNTAAIKYISVAKSKKQQRKITTTFLLSIGIFTLITTILLFVFKTPLGQLLKVSQAVLIFAILYTVSLVAQQATESIFKAKQKFKLLSKLTISSAIVITIIFFSAFFLLKNTTFTSYALASIGGCLVYLVALLFKQKVKISSFSASKFMTLLNYGKYATLGNINGFVLNNLNRLILNKFLGPSSVGLFTAYTNASLLILGQLTIIFLNVFFPTAAKHQNPTAIVNKINRLFKLSFIPFTLINILVIVFVLKLYGSQYQLKLSYAILFSINAMAYSAAQILLWLNNSLGVSGIKSTVIASSVFSLISLPLNIGLISQFGIYGAVTTSTILSLSFYFLFKNKLQNQNNK